MHDDPFVSCAETTISIPITIEVKPGPEGLGHRAQLMAGELVILSCDGWTPHDALAALFSNFQPATQYHLKKYAMSQLPPLVVKEKGSNNNRRWSHRKCSRGHVWTQENTRYSVDSRGRRFRHCRQCEAAVPESGREVPA